MKTYAIIKDGKVTAVYYQEDNKPAPAGSIEAPAGTECNDTFDGTTWTPDDSRRIAAIKAKASEVILDAFPEWKQRNMIARAVELKTKASLSASEQAELDDIQGVWDWVVLVRTESDRLEADQALTAANANWPSL